MKRNHYNQDRRIFIPASTIFYITKTDADGGYQMRLFAFVIRVYGRRMGIGVNIYSIMNHFVGLSNELYGFVS